MALATPDMNDCTPKQRCLTGPNIGQIYTPGKECPPSFSFNTATCDCDAVGPPTYNFKILVVFAGGTEVTATWTSFEADPNKVLMWQAPLASSGTSFAGDWPGVAWASSVSVSNVNNCGGTVTQVGWARYGDPNGDPADWGTPFSGVDADFTGTPCNSMCGNGIPGCDGKSWTANFQYFRESTPGSGNFDTPFDPATGT